MRKTPGIILTLLLHLAVTGLQGQELLNEYTMKLSEAAADAAYGTSENNPVKVGMASDTLRETPNAQRYLNALRGPKGEAVTYTKLGSCCPFDAPNVLYGGSALLDLYRVEYPGIKKPVTLYINRYHFEQPKSPAGFTFHTLESANDPANFSPQMVKTVTPCDSAKLFAVDDAPLRKKIEAEGYKRPTQSPQYEGGRTALMDYLRKYRLTDTRAKNPVFNVSIAFLVNCNGTAGNYRVIERPEGELSELADHVLAIINGLPQNWTAAKFGSATVDCWQILNFTVINGDLTKVSYK